MGKALKISLCAVALCLGLLGCSDGKAAFVGTWKLVDITAPEQSSATTELGMAFIKALGMDAVLQVNDDGTASFEMLGQSIDYTWELDGTGAIFTYEGQGYPASIEDGQLVLSNEGATIVFEKTDASARVGSTSSSTQQDSASSSVHAAAEQESTASDEVKESSAPAADDEPRLVIKDSGYVLSDGYVMYAVAIENLSTTQAAEFPEIRVTGRAPDNSISFNDTWTLGTLEPGTTTYWANQAGDGNTTGDDTIQFDVSISADNWVRPSGIDVEALYTIENTSVRAGEYGDVSATGEITLNGDYDKARSDVKQPMVVAVFKDTQGKIVGGFNGYLFSDLTVGTSTPFEIDGYFDLPDYETCEFYANPWM